MTKKEKQAEKARAAKHIKGHLAYYDNLVTINKWMNQIVGFAEEQSEFYLEAAGRMDDAEICPFVQIHSKALLLRYQFYKLMVSKREFLNDRVDTIIECCDFDLARVSHYFTEKQIRELAKPLFVKKLGLLDNPPAEPLSEEVQEYKEACSDTHTEYPEDLLIKAIFHSPESTARISRCKDSEDQEQ